MGLFDKIVGARSEVRLTKTEAFAGVMLATVASDGHISEEEVAGFQALTSQLRLFQAQTASEHRVMIDKLFGVMNRTSPGELLALSASTLPADLRESAFAVAADLVFADGSVQNEERALLEKLQERLMVPDDLAVQIVRVMEIKNRG